MAIENIKDLEASLKLKEGTITEALESEDKVKIEIPELKIFTPEEDEERINNMKGEFKSAGEEIAVKELKREHNLEFEGKSAAKLFEHLQSGQETAITKALSDAGKEPDAKITELNADKEKLQAKITEQESAFTSLQSDFTNHKNTSAINGQIQSAFGDTKTAAPMDVVLNTFTSQFQAEVVEGKTVYRQNGEVLKNDLQTPLTTAEVVERFKTAEANKWVFPVVEGGNGGGDDTQKGKAGSMQAFEKEMNDNGHRTGSLGYVTEMNKRLSEKTLTM
jgi:hypothetical protein